MGCNRFDIGSEMTKSINRIMIAGMLKIMKQSTFFVYEFSSYTKVNIYETCFGDSSPRDFTTSCHSVEITIGISSKMCNGRIAAISFISCLILKKKKFTKPVGKRYLTLYNINLFNACRCQVIKKNERKSTWFVLWVKYLLVAFLLSGNNRFIRNACVC